MSFGITDIFNTSFAAVGSDAWITVAFVLAILAAVGGYFFFVKPEKNYPNKIVNWLRSFLNFQEMLIEPILKITYIFVTIYIVLSSFSLISYKFMTFLTYLIVGVIGARIVYEASMILIGIWKNTKEINKKMK